MPRMIFVNLPVRDLAAATRFYEAIGCEKNAQFSGETSASMAWSETFTFQLLTRDYFAIFTEKPIADAHRTCGFLIALPCDSRDEVDALTEAAAAAGGRVDVHAPQDLGFMYVRTFEDPDGHMFEPAWMDMPAAAGGEAPDGD